MSNHFKDHFLLVGSDKPVIKNLNFKSINFEYAYELDKSFSEKDVK